MAYTSWENASWSTSSADALCEDGNHVVLEVVSVAVPNLLNLRPHTRVEAAAVGVDSVAAALNVVAADSVEAVVGSAEDVEEEEDLVTEAALVTAEEVVSEVVAVASEATETTLDHREVEGATGRWPLIGLAFLHELTRFYFMIEVGLVDWDTKVEDSMTARLRAGMEVPLDQAVGLVDQVGTVLLVEVQVTAPLEAEVPVVTAATEDISSERAQEDLMTETPSGRDSRCFAIARLL